MAIYQGDIGIHDIKLGSIDVFEIYQGSKLVYPENTEVTITLNWMFPELLLLMVILLL